jgi:hypothetical protein
MSLFGILVLFMLFCPGVHAVTTEGAFPDIPFKVFSAFITNTFGPKVSLSTVLMLLFTLNANTDLLNLHARSKNKRFQYEQVRSSSTWMNALSGSIQKNTTKKKLKSLFKPDEMPEDLLGEEATELTSIKLNAFANLLGLNPYGSDGKFKQKLYPISNQSIEPLLVICPTSYCCMDNGCEPRSLLMLTRTNQIPEVTLIKGTKIFKNVLVLSAYCPKCDTSYFVDHETYGPLNDKRKTYLNDATYLKVGQNTYVDRIFSNAVVNGVYSFHASTAAYAEFWTNSYGKGHSVKVPRRQIWQTFIQESIRSVSQSLEITFETNNNPSIAELTNKAYDSLGENGGIRLSDGHACSECTQEYKATADYAPQNNDPAAVLGVDNEAPIPGLANGNVTIPIVPNQAPNDGATTEKSPVKMVVMDGIVMGPIHCAAINCTADVLNARGEAFCATHVTQFANKCRVVGCSNIKVQGTQACAQHRQDWVRHQQSRTKSTLSGVRRMLNHQDENLAWNENVEREVQPHDEEAPEAQPKHYFSPARFYCVETLCAPCGVVIAWTKFAKSESPTKILKFLKDTYPDKNTRPDYVCIDKACLVLKTSLSNGSWEEWKETTRLIVDAFHYCNHRVKDFLCRIYCNPAPLDGSAPNLVIEAEADDGTKYLKRAFNTQACEQLNGWLGGFDSILKRMTQTNFNWFLHVMLFYYTRNVLNKQEENSPEEEDDPEFEDLD